MSDSRSTRSVTLADAEGSADSSVPVPDWKRILAARLRQGPNAERAAMLASGLLEVAPAAALEAAARDPQSWARILAALCGTAPFLSAFLRRHPERLIALTGEDFTRPVEREELGRRLAQYRRRGSADAPAAWLREFKYYELARITVRDAAPEWLPLERSEETLRELSTLADLLLDEALRIVCDEIAATDGPPVWRDPRGEEHELGFCVLGLGKLGSSELNFSSDVDLLYVHESAPEGAQQDGPGGLNPQQYFTRVAQRFGRLVSEVTADGFLYRVDLDLRPEGAQGLLVISENALEQYYESWAETWEKAAFMKARPIAGDLRLGWRAVRAMAPMIYRSTMDFGSVAGIRELKDKIETSRSRGDGGFDVKVGAGGIRDLEFVVQALQLLHGGRIAQLRERSTARSLEHLGALGLLAADEAAALLDAYRFLRRLENRLQMEAERQTHLLPDDDARRRQVARALAYDDRDERGHERFEDDLARHRDRARQAFQSLLPGGGPDRVLDLFEHNAPQLFHFPTTQRMLAELAERFAREIDTRADPERALNNLARFVSSVGQSRFYYDLLLDRPELVPRLTALFDASNYLSQILASHPRLIEPVFSDPDVLLLGRAELEADLRALGGDTTASVDIEGALDVLRLFHHRHVLNIGLLDLAERVSYDEAEAALSDVAEVCLEGALRLAQVQLAERHTRLGLGDRVRFLVIGMGKLASHELSYGSDLDLVFLFDVDDGTDAERLEATDYCVRIAQRLIGALQTTTAEGRCYEIDARLRPSGNQGTLVTSLPGFERYHTGEEGRGADAWEQQALLRARAVAGDATLAARFEALRRKILGRPPPADLREQIDRIRRRMEEELARETASQRDFKTGRGGVLDIESIVQLEQLESAGDDPALLDAVPVALLLERLRERGALDADQAEVLQQGWRFLKTLSSRLRIVENRSISQLDEERGDLEGLALRMGYSTSGREGGARRSLLRDYAEHTEAIRQVYTSIFAG